MNRAYSLLSVKEMDETKRTITGIASTPTIDRVGDSVDPMGAKFKTPMPLLLYHQSNMPVGSVDFAKPTKNGIPFSASLPIIAEAGTLKDRVDEAWQSIKYRLIASVSIGFSPLKDGVELLKDGGLLFKAWEWLELSLCAVPANPEAVIQSYKAMDQRAILRALGVEEREDEQRLALVEALKKKGIFKLTPVSREPKPGVVRIK